MKLQNVFPSFSARAIATICASLLLTTACGSDNNSAAYNPQNPLGEGPAPLSLDSGGAATVTPGDMASAGSYVILSKTGISNVPGSAIVGNIGSSPVAATYITGFSLVAHASNVYATSAEVTGKVYAANYAVPTPSNMTSAIGNMETAYVDATLRTNPDFVELHAGDIGSKTLVPGLYKWGTSVLIPTDVTLDGGADDVWIFQISGDLTMSSAKNVFLTGGAQAKNVFWQVAGQVVIGTTSAFQGIILCKTGVTLDTGATLDGRIFSQTLVSLDANAVTEAP